MVLISLVLISQLCLLHRMAFRRFTVCSLTDGLVLEGVYMN
jgi:hypothetical protein